MAPNCCIFTTSSSKCHTLTRGRSINVLSLFTISLSILLYRRVVIRRSSDFYYRVI